MSDANRPVPQFSYPSWNYSSTELFADGAVHTAAIALGLVGATFMIVKGIDSVPAAELMALFVYVTALLAMIGISAAYNMWPVSPTKWILRRFDHSAIYLMIAGTYTPLLTQVKASLEASALLTGVWAAALGGAVLKLAFPGRFDRLSIVIYLLLGWSIVAVYDSVVPTLPVSAVVLLVIGGVLYSSGVVFHVWSSLQFQNAIWHAFVLAAAACHWAAVFEAVVLARE